MKRVALALVVLAASLGNGVACAQEAPGLHVTGVEASVSRRVIHAAIGRTDLAQCQHTWNGGTLRLDVTIEAGAFRVVQASGPEEVRGYARCVRARLARARLPANAAGRAHVAIVFPALGLAPRG
jgi:hypothetical protein